MPDTKRFPAEPESQSLEKAFALNMEHVKAAMAFVPYDDEEERRCAEENAAIAARNLALAVYTAALHLDNKDSPKSWHELRAYIAALGEVQG